MRFSHLLLAGTMVAGLSFASAPSAHAFPSFGADAGPGLIITITDSGITTTFTGEVPYDSFIDPITGAVTLGEDTYIGVINNSSHDISTLGTLTGTNIFGFDGDGIDVYGAPDNTMDATGYGGPNTFFVFDVLDPNTGVVNFVTPLAAGGGSTYFSLEESITLASQITITAPEPASIALLGAALAGMGVVRRRTKRG